MSDDTPPEDAGSAPRVGLTKGSGSGPVGGAAVSPPEPDPWAPPGADAPARGPEGPGYTMWSAPTGPAGPSVPSAPSGPPAPSVHDQQTVTSLPTPGAGAWPPPANPFAVPDAVTPPPPYAQYGQGEAVPPPPIAPDGPGQVAYGYPGPYGAAGGYGAPGGYGYPWGGMQPMPSNGLGTASLVLGIISAAGFCLWPLAIVLGVLALIFGLVGRAKVRRGEATNAGQALAGAICGVAGLVLGLCMIAFLVARG
ncbi:DUF4190 domain-containing protein [Streptomyces sp. NPDC058867]|uniref:DUF4190 domain-containing protein n=1 Tax=unclassified Streptomyces TaxID=2593676 RepID=UPI0036BC2AE7